MYKVGVIGAGKVGVSLGKYFFSNFDPVFSEDSCKDECRHFTEYVYRKY